MFRLLGLRNLFGRCKSTPRKQRAQVCSAGNCYLGLAAVERVKQPPRRASAEPEARHVACFFPTEFVPRLDPGPRRKRGPGFKTREDAGSRWSPLAPGAALTVGEKMCFQAVRFPQRLLPVSQNFSGGPASEWIGRGAASCS